MARIPEVIRSRAVSNVATQPPRAGQGFAALSELAKAAAEFVEPAAQKEAQEAGFDATYRDENGQLKVAEKSVFGGRNADIHNAAAFSKYMSQRSIDMAESFTELARKHEFDPNGFKQASDAYIGLLEADESIPRLLKEDLLANARKEASRRFNGLYNQETARNYKESERNTAAHRDMLVDDAVNLFAGGDTKAAEEKLAEIEQISAFRANAAYIPETEVEAQAFMRGVNSAAKAARLMRILTDTSGSTSLSVEQRSEIEDLLADPDLKPKTREMLYLATQGHLKAIDAGAFVRAATDDSYEAKVVHVESAGKSGAKNPNSTATGPHQFIGGTWLQHVKSLRKRGGAQWSVGMRDDQILDMRTDAGASSEVFQHFRENNAAVLTKAGISVNDTTE